MKKSRNRTPTGNPAKQRPGPPADGKQSGWSRWMGRELRAFLDLPEWLVLLIFVVVAGVAVGVWRWLAA